MVEFNNLTKEKVNIQLLKNITERILRREKRTQGSLSVVFMGEKQMRELNRVYRGKDYSTNVLSFPEETFELGEIVLCPRAMRKDAKKYGITFTEELMRVFIHGLLHLLGYNHERDEREALQMEKKEHFYLSRFLNSQF